MSCIFNVQSKNLPLDIREYFGDSAVVVDLNPKYRVDGRCLDEVYTIVKFVSTHIDPSNESIDM